MIELTNEGTENDGATMKQTDAVADVNGDGETTIMTEMNPPPTAQMSFREKQNELRRDRGRFYTVRVENLSFDATAGDVQNMFEHTLGETVEDVYLPKDYRGGKLNRGFGFVRFLEPRSSRRAVAEMNGIEHLGRVLDVTFERQQRPEPYFRGRQEPYSRGIENRLSRGYDNNNGFQHRAGRRSHRGGASSYYDDADGYDDGYHNGRSSEMKSKKGAINSLGLPAVTSNVRCHVSNLAWETTEDSLTELCKTMGHNIVRCKVARMPNGKSKGWALMDFESTEQMEAGVKALHNTDLEGRYIVVRTERKAVAAEEPNEQEGATNSSGLQVVVRNLPWTTTESDLSDSFAEVGTVTAATVSRFSDSGRSKGWATVRFETEEAAQAAIDRFNGTDFGGREVEVRIDRFE